MKSKKAIVTKPRKYVRNPYDGLVRPTAAVKPETYLKLRKRIGSITVTRFFNALFEWAADEKAPPLDANVLIARLKALPPTVPVRRAKPPIKKPKPANTRKKV